ncbi:MAG: helix-turn-helix domain-containing protein, partial [Rickettsiales bacterium]|nr:helix-turn-helix domain-containing protein [Rickettsiales bacterium]
TLEELSKKINMSRGNLSQIERGKVKITQENVDKLTTTLNVSVSELFGEQPIGQNQVKMIKYTDNITSINSYSEIENVEMFIFDEKFLSFVGIRDKFKNILIIKAPNNSMYPIIENGDVVFVDIGEREIIRDGLYIILEQGILQIRKAVIDKKNERITISITNKSSIGNIENNYKQDELVDRVYGRILFYTKSLF